MVTMLQPVLRRVQTAVSLPVVMKEMRSRMRGMRAPILLFIATALAITVGLLIIAPQWEDSYAASPAMIGSHLSSIGRNLFIGLLVLEGILCALIAPALTSGTISVEREQQTLEMLLLTRLSNVNIVLGKFISSMSFLGIILLCSLPVMSISFLLGGVDPAQMCWALAIIVSTVLLFGAIGLFCSSRFRTTTASVAASYALCIAWLAVVPLIIGLLSLWDSISSTWGEESGIFVALGLVVFILLMLATLPAAIASLIWTLLRHHRPPRLMNLIFWGGGAIGTSLLLYLPGALDLLAPEYLLFGNPVVAMGIALFGEQFVGTGPSYLQALFVPCTVLLNGLFAGVFMNLTVGELRRLRR